METPLSSSSLLDRWLRDPDVLVIDQASAAVARARVRDVGAGLANDLVEKGALIASELAMNQVRHAAGGRFSARRIARDGVAGIELVAADRGRGLADPTAAFVDKPFAVGGSLGAGLGAVFRLADEVDVDARVLEGTLFRARVFATSPRRRRELGIYGRPFPGELVSGDDASSSPGDDDVFTLAVADGLGHGVDARAASARAVAVVSDAPLGHSIGGDDDHGTRVRDPGDVLRAAERGVAGTRGATMAVVAHDRRAGTLAHAAVGDVATRVVRSGAAATKLAGQAGTLGALRRVGRTRTEVAAVSPGDVVIVATDGLTSSGDAVIVAGRHPILVAHELATRHAREHDDVLVAVLRLP